MKRLIGANITTTFKRMVHKMPMIYNHGLGMSLSDYTTDPRSFISIVIDDDKVLAYITKEQIDENELFRSVSENGAEVEVIADSGWSREMVARNGEKVTLKVKPIYEET